MASARKDSTKRLNAKLRKVENDLVRAQEKAHGLINQIKEVKVIYDRAMNNTDEALRERDYNVSREQRECEWKKKIMRWSDSNKRDVKWLSEQVDYLKDKIDNQEPSRRALKYSGTMGMFKKAMVYGFGLAFGLAMGLATTAMPN